MAAIDALFAAGDATGPAPITWSRPTPVENTEAFIDTLARVDPARRAVAEAQRERLADLLARHARTAPKALNCTSPCASGDCGPPDQSGKLALD